jgi:hypothetical protein
MTLQTRVRVAAEQSPLWTALMPARIFVETIAFLLTRVVRADDAGERDRVAVEVMADSAMGRSLTALVAATDRAWTTSVVRRYAIQTTQPFLNASLSEALRLGGITAIAASATALALRLAASPPAPLTWIVPSVAAMFGAAVIVATRKS